MSPSEVAGAWIGYPMDFVSVAGELPSQLRGLNETQSIIFPLINPIQVESEEVD
jgi:hypothetical protein